jgi:hypothetical protein
LFEIKHKEGLFSQGLSKNPATDSNFPQSKPSAKDVTNEDEIRTHFDFNSYRLSVIESAANRVRPSSKPSRIYRPGEGEKADDV